MTTMVKLSLAVTLALGATACSGAGFLLKAPVTAACEKTKLKGCDTAAEGVVLYVDGNKAEAKKKLAKAGAKNAPADVRRFAKALELLENIPGATKYVGPAIEAAKLMADPKTVAAGKSHDDDEDAADSADASSAARTSDAPDASDDGRDDSTERRNGVVEPSANGSRKRCNAPLGSGSASCVKVAKGPLFVTDLKTSKACAEDLFVYSGSLDGDPSWLVTGDAIGVRGGRLLVRDGESLIIGSRTSGCQVAWSGVKHGKRLGAEASAD